MANIPCLSLSSGSKIPVLGFGTGALGPMRQMSDDDARRAIDAGLRAGYRHIDTAAVYGNEHLIGEVLKEWLTSGKVKREELFVTTKLPPSGHGEEDVDKWMLRSLEKLKLDYVDLYLIHFPAAFKAKEMATEPLIKDGRICLDLEPSLESTWRAMEKQVRAKRARSIGLSNFNSEQIGRILKVCEIRPAALQVEVHAYHQQIKLREFCQANGISVCAYAPLAAPKMPFSAKLPTLIEDESVVEIANRLKRTPAQVLLRYMVQQGLVAVSKSANPERMTNNLKIFDFELTAEDMKVLKGLDKGKEARIYSMKTLYLGIDEHPEYPFHIPF